MSDICASLDVNKNRCVKIENVFIYFPQKLLLKKLLYCHSSNTFPIIQIIFILAAVSLLFTSDFSCILFDRYA